MALGKTYIVEHLDPELGPWSELEYIAVAKETQETNGSFLLSSLPAEFKVPAGLSDIPAFRPEHRGVEELYADNKARVCLLDPAAAKDLSPEDGDKFDAFLFGGILGTFTDAIGRTPLLMKGTRRRSPERFVLCLRRNRRV
jgi:ribosome biogenesis SPOUT family RNA methylase Rps3